MNWRNIKIIDDANVVENYKPTIDIDPSEMVELNNAALRENL